MSTHLSLPRAARAERTPAVIALHCSGGSGRAWRNPSQAVASSCERRPSAIASAPARPSGGEEDRSDMARRYLSRTLPGAKE